jgi:hypothetical protein
MPSGRSDEIVHCHSSASTQLLPMFNESLMHAVDHTLICCWLSAHQRPVRSRRRQSQGDGALCVQSLPRTTEGHGVRIPVAPPGAVVTLAAAKEGLLSVGCSTQRAAATPCGTVHCVQLSANCPQHWRASVMGASIQQARAGRIERAVWASPVTICTRLSLRSAWRHNGLGDLGNLTPALRTSH